MYKYNRLAVIVGILSFFASACNSEDNSNSTECQNDTYQCDGAKLQKCISDKWETQEKCDDAKLCSAGDMRCLTESEALEKPATECQTEAYRCDKAQLQKCIEGKWEKKEDCQTANQCSANEKRCLDENKPIKESECSEDGYQCVAGKLQKCTSGQWEVQADCKSAQLCSSGDKRCLTEEEAKTKPQSECLNDSIKCDGQKLQRCLNGFWKTAEICEEGELCSAENKGCAIPGATGDSIRCKEERMRCNTHILEKCVEGEWKSEKTCFSVDHCNIERSQCVPCVPGEHQCVGPLQETCVDYKWETKASCGNASLCNPQLGRCNECVSGKYQCKGAELQLCDESGMWKTEQTCGSAGLCSVDRKQCDECQANETPVCEGDTRRFCKDGKWVEKKCTEGCEGTECKADQCPNNPTKLEPGKCGCEFDDLDLNGDGEIECPVKTIPDGILPELPDLEGSCAEWEYPKHPVIEYPDLPEYSYETTIDTAKYGIVNKYDPSTAEANTKAFEKAIEDAKAAGYTRIRFPAGHYAVHHYPGIKVPDHTALIFGKDVILQMIPSNSYDCNILSLRSRSHIYIEGGEFIGNKYTHTGKKEDEECNIIMMYYAHHILINGGHYKEAHGDAIGIPGIVRKTGELKSNNIIIANCDIDSAYRNGIAVDAVDGLRITNNEIHHTDGTWPKVGIDLESHGKRHTNHIKNIIIDHNYFHDNVAGDLNTDAYDQFIEYNRFSQGDMEKYVDGPFIVRSYSSYIFNNNTFEKFTDSIG